MCARLAANFSEFLPSPAAASESQLQPSSRRLLCRQLLAPQLSFLRVICRLIEPDKPFDDLSHPLLRHRSTDGFPELYAFVPFQQQWLGLFIFFLPQQDSS